jgi:hypothetical protein
MNTCLNLSLAKLSRNAISHSQVLFRPWIYSHDSVISVRSGWRSASPVCRIDGVKWYPTISMADQQEERSGPQVTAKIDVPLALFGPDAQHALSVHAAGLAALELLRIVLAAHGISREELDHLNEDDVRLLTTVATYFVPCEDRLEVLHLLENIDRAGAVLNRRAKSNLTTDFRVTLPYERFTVVASACQSARRSQLDDPTSVIANYSSSHALRIDVQVSSRYAECEHLAEWRDADTARLYEDLFDVCVRGKLRFNDCWLTHQIPQLADDKYSYLTPTAKQLLLWYLSGNDPHAFKDFEQSPHSKKELSELVLFIRRWMRIDINIPWKYHATLRCEEMEQRLRYTKLWQTSLSDSLWYVRDENWGPVRQALNARYENVIQSAGQRRRSRMYAPII